MSSAPLKTIPETFAGADVFITGGSGFMGKVLIEKLLRSCPGINQVFVLIRPKKGKTPEERIDELVQIPLFDVLRKTRPEDLRKIIPISGDCSVLKLDLDETSLKRLENVQFVFHAAASVRFDDPLAKAILLNTRGTREVCRWAETLKNLKAIVHISTTFCNPEIFDVEERIYPAKMDWRKAIEIAENVDPETLEILSQKLTDSAPNTYTFTKGLAEQICHDYRSTLPLIIFRPSVVTNTEAEPIPGWIDNFNGPMGMMLGCATGVLRTGNVKLENHINCIPADVAIKAILVAAWKRANHPEDGLAIYNCAAEPHKTVTYKFLITDGEFVCYRAPTLKILWAPGGSSTDFVYLYYLMFFLAQLVPAVLIDLLLKARNRKPFLTKLQRRIFHAQTSLKYFSDNEWLIRTDNFRALARELHDSDRQWFNINYMCDGLVWYYFTCTLGGRRYLFKESDDTIPAAIKKLRRYMMIDRVIKLSAVFAFLKIIYSKYFVDDS
ncbi:putative fatty acyl-CoA reductase CG5065 isoform X2 [Toxorhynchites rutilus septentrionalis]|uniref:putative fatty acyl-CoA reductase CG5065 isoform X2 n=1 Tax=Toxorhynchites rutilus septentrionalis TaxID=329112 RepID=UPI00247A3A30|nr:putative fatty acyl-CoA reductase CG5065 isoform X2 [Toxorhynchites rutilus septentrionalis]